jgi:L-asparaginase
MAKPRIKLILAGGTIGMIRNPRTHALQPTEDVGAILKIVPELQKEMTLHMERVMNIDSTNMKPEHWAEIAKTIEKDYDKYDGFVVAHGTDTMAYTASALSFALQNLSKPVVCTGALMPLNELGSDGRNNLIYACRIATFDIAEVCIVFGSRIFRGNRTTKYREAFFDVFESPNFPELGEIVRPIKLNPWRKKRRKRVPKFNSNFNNKVAVIKIFPGFDPAYIEHMIFHGIEGIVLEGFGPGNIPGNLVETIKKDIHQGIPIVISTQMGHGTTNLEAYEVGYKALKAGAIEAKDMTTEACITKLMWCLGKTKNMASIRKMMGTDYAGEITLD